MSLFNINFNKNDMVDNVRPFIKYWLSPLSTLIAAIITSCVTFIVGSVAFNGVIAQINNSNIPVLDIVEVSDIRMNDEFVSDYNQHYDEYALLEGKELNLKRFGVIPVNIKFKNNGKETLFDLKIVSLYNNQQLSSIDKENMVDMINKALNVDKTHILLPSTILVNVSSLNIGENFEVIKKGLVLYNNNYMGSEFFDQCLNLCLYRDINNKIYTSILKIDYTIPILKIDDKDFLAPHSPKLEYGLFPENSTDYIQIVDNEVSLKSTIKTIVDDYKNAKIR